MKRKAVEQKLEEKQKEEKEKLKTERQQLFIDRKEKIMQIKQLENKIELAELVSILFSVLVLHSNLALKAGATSF